MNAPESLAELAVTSEEVVPDTAANTALEDVIRQCRAAFYFIFGLTFLINLLSVTPILYMLNMYDRVMNSRSGVTLVSLVVLVMGLYLFWAGLEWVRARLLVRISLRIDWDLAASTFDASFRRHVSNKRINVHQIMGDLLALRQFMTGRGILAIIDAPFSVIFILVGLFFHPYLALFTAAATALLIAMALVNRSATTEALNEAQRASTEANRLAAQSLRYSETALAMGMLPAIRRQWHAQHRSFLQRQINASEASGMVGMMSGVLSKLMPAFQIALGAYLAIQGLITAGMVIAASFLISRAVGPLQTLIGNWRDIVGARSAFDRLKELHQEDRIAKAKMSLPPPVGRIDVQGLTLRAPGGKQVILHGLQFALPPGATLAVVGPNAAGKSSLLRALMGIWRPTRGSVRLDGAEVADCNHDELGPHVGYVPQEPELFEGTVAQNVARLGEVDAEKVVKACQLAGIHEALLALPQGYDTLLGEDGHRLSGGQAQRLCIARALYGNPRLLVLDEPNAKLDDASELSLIRTLRLFKRNGSTIVFSSHRPKLINIADYLLVLKDGRQVGFGPLQEVLAQGREAATPAAPPTAAPGIAAPTAAPSPAPGATS